MSEKPFVCGSSYCTWSENLNGGWDTSCGHSFFFEYDTPSQNGAKFCLYCGKDMVERLYSGEEATAAAVIQDGPREYADAVADELASIRSIVDRLQRENEELRRKLTQAAGVQEAAS